MRKFQTSFAEALTRGLRPDARVQKHTQYLATCYGWRPTEWGLVGERTVSNPVSGSFDPTAQFLQGKTIYLVDWTSNTAAIKPVTTSGWTLGSDILTAGQAPSAHNNTTATTLTTDSLPFGLIEKDGVYLAWTGSSWLQNIWGSWQVATATNSVIFNAACFHQDRIIVGGLSTGSSILSTAPWPNALQLSRHMSDELIVPSSSAISNEWLLLGARAGGAVDSPFVPTAAMLGGYKLSTIGDDLLQFFRDRGMRLVRPPWGGEVLALASIGQLVVIGTTKAVGLMQIADDGRVGFRQVHEYGIQSRTAFSVGPGAVTFPDTRGEAIRISADGSRTVLGFSEYLGDLTLGSCWGLWESIDGGSVFSDGSSTVVLGDRGGYTSRYAPFSLLSGFDEVYGTLYATGSAAKQIETHRTDFRYNGVKRTGWLAAGQQGCSSLSFVGKFTHNRTDDLSSTAAVGGNYEDMAYVPCTGVDLAVNLSCTAAESATLNDLRVEWELVDRRYLRGLNEGIGTAENV